MIREIVKKYSNISIQEKATIWNTVCNAVIRGIQYLLIPIYIRLMSQDEYGIYTISFSWTEIIMIFTSLNMFSTTYSVALTKWHDKKDEVTSSAVSLLFIWSVFIMAILCTKRGMLENLLKVSTHSLAYLGLYLLFEPIKLMWCAKQKFLNKYKLLIAVTFIDAMLNLLIGILFLLQFKDKVVGAIAAKTISEGVIGVALLCEIFKKSKLLFKWEYWRYMLTANIPLLPYFLALRLLQHLDRIMIQNLINSAEAAIYGFAYSITNTLLIINTSINGTFTPWLFMSLKKGIRDVKKVYQMLLFGIAGVNIVLILFAPEIVKLLGTNQYAKAAYFIPPLALSSIIIFIYDKFISIELFFEKNKGGILIAIICVLINGVLNYYFIPIWGSVVAGYTTLISYVIFALLHYFYYKRILREKNIQISLFGAKSMIYTCEILILISAFMVSCYKYFHLRLCFAIFVFLGLFYFRKQITYQIHSFRQMLNKSK